MHRLFFVTFYLSEDMWVLLLLDYRNYKLCALYHTQISKLKLITIMKQFKNESLPFIRLDPQTNKLTLTPESKKFLQQLSNPISITSIAGLYRTGKSYLVNKLIPSCSSRQQEYTFGVGTTTQSMTKGLNILSNPIIIPCKNSSHLYSPSSDQQNEDDDQNRNQEIYYLLVDSQGLGSCQRSTKYDMDLLILLFLISSTVVYNSMGAIDQQSLEQLQVVLQLKKCIDMTQHKYDSCSYRYRSDPPKFIWVLRDFSLQLIDKTGKQLTPDEYLEQCLEQSQFQNQQSRKKNQIRKAIKQNLGERHCYTLVRPTIKQQDLQSLASYRIQSQNYGRNNKAGQKGENEGKIRAQFIGQIEQIKGKLFAGNWDDVKRINGHCLTGRMFVKILQQYLDVINRNELPKVTDIWSSVIKTANQQKLEQIIDKLEREAKQIQLPLGTQQLKLKLNQIQNRLYKALQKHLAPSMVSGLEIENRLNKEYERQFLKAVQKINKQLREKNQQIRKNYVLNDLHAFVRDNLKFEDIRIEGLADGIKNFIERLKIRVQGLAHGYQYVLGVIIDIFFVVQQKYSKNSRQLTELKNLYQNLQLDTSNLQLSHKSLKREYHESLKTIARLQEQESDTTKTQNQYQSKLLSQERNIERLELQLSDIKYRNEKLIQEMQQKNKYKIDELNNQIKKLSKQKREVEDELEELSNKFRDKECENRKEVIFEERMRESFDKFHQQKLALKKQIQSYKKQNLSISQKYNQLKTQYEKQEERQRQMQEHHSQKQQNLMKQFENLKQTLKQTKASYQRTYQTYQTTQHKMNKITVPSTSKKDKSDKGMDKGTQKYQTPGKEALDEQDWNIERVDGQMMQSNRMLKKYYESQIQKIEQEHRLQIRRLQDEISNMQKQLTRKDTEREMHEMSAKQYKEKCLKLESDMVGANAKFNKFLKELEQGKQKQRSLYQQSIVRLLNNIEKRDRDYKDKDQQNRHSFTATSGIEERFSINIPNTHQSYAHRRKDFPADNSKDSLSFGHPFRTK